MAAMRIVSLAPSVTSILIALGAREHLVGVTRWCKTVARVGRLPQLGDCWALDLEQLTQLRPTLVIGGAPYKSETVAQIVDTGVPFLATNPRTLAGIYADIRRLGGIVARPASAERLIHRMQSAFKQIARGGGKRKRRPRVYCEAWPKPRITSPPWVDELVRLADGTPALPGGKKITDADVARARPDVIVLAWTATGNRARVKSTLKNPAWRNVPAASNCRVYVVRDELLNTPGPPLVAGARALRRILRASRTR